MPIQTLAAQPSAEQPSAEQASAGQPAAGQPAAGRECEKALPVTEKTRSIIQRVGSNDEETVAEDRAIAIVTSDDAAATDAMRRSRSKLAAGKKKARSSSWVSWLVPGAVGLLLLASLTMFLFRHPATQSTAVPDVDADSFREGTHRLEVTQSSGAVAERTSDSRAGDLMPGLPPTNLPMLAEDTEADAEALVSVESSQDINQGREVEFRLPPVSAYALPTASRSRERVLMIDEGQPRTTLRSAVDKAFIAYEETQALKASSEESKSQPDIKKYHHALGTTLGLLRHVQNMAVSEDDQEQVNSMRYLLAYLSYTAGHLPEAMIFGEAVARWGGQDEPATREAGMIALAAVQEACETQWGQSDRVGELDQMRSIVGVLAERWPDDPQLDAIWMNLAYLNEAFNRPTMAIEAYDHLAESSESFGLAQVSSGLVAWRLARKPSLGSGYGDRTADAASDVVEEIDSDLRDDAKRRLVRGLKGLEKASPEDAKTQVKGSLTEAVVNARLALAQIELTSGKRKEASQWLIDSSGTPIVDLIAVTGNQEDGKKLRVPETTARQIFDVLLFVSQANGDVAVTQELLAKLSEIIESADERIEATRMTMIKQELARLQALTKLNRGDVDTFAQLVAPWLEEISTVPTSTLLWLAESWGQLGQRADDTSLQSSCYSTAADLFGKAMERTDFPAGSAQAAQLRRLELLRKSGQLEEAMVILTGILAKTQNVLSLQMEAAELLQQMAMAPGGSSNLQAAIDGPGGFSPIWGWSRLVTSLHSMRWSEHATDVHVHQLMKAQYHLAECRYIAATKSSDRMTRARELAEIERAVRTILATIDAESEWQQPYSVLLEVVTKARR